MSDLTIRLTVPILAGRGVSASGLTFSRCLPLSADDEIRVEDADLSLALRFQIESTWWAHQPTAQDIPQTVNVLAHRLYADITVTNLCEEFLAYLRRRDFRHHATAEDADLQAQCDRLAERSLVLTLRTVNRLISYVRSRKGQYWLLEYDIDLGRCADFFSQFEAKARFDGSEWFRFGPSNIPSLTVVLGPEDRYIRADEWRDIRDFVVSSRRPPLARTLLAGAETLAANGHSRSALTEAVTALEVALYAFARHPSAERTFGPVLAKRMSVGTLHQQMEHLGLSGSVRYLLPVLLPDSVLPEDVLEGCRTAIEQRQTVVHQGQRDVASGSLQSSLRAVRSLCDILEGLSHQGGDDTAAGVGERSGFAADGDRCNHEPPRLKRDR